MTADHTTDHGTTSHGGADYSLRDLLAVVFKHRAAVVAVLVSTVCAVGVWTFLSPPIFEVSAAILVKNSRGVIPITPTASPQVFVNPVREEDLNSEIEILRSRRLIEETLQTLQIDADWRPPGLLDGLTVAGFMLTQPPQVPTVDELTLHLMENIKIESVQTSNVVTLAYRSGNADFAVDVLQGILDRYLDTRGRVFQPPQAVAFFDEQTQTAEQRLRRAEERLQQYIEGVGISMPFEPQKVEVLQTLSQFQRQLAEARVALRADEGALRAVETQMSQEPRRLPSAHRDNLDPTTEQIRTSLIALELERDELMQEFGPRNRKIRDLDAQLQLTRRRLNEAEAAVGELNRTELNTVHQDLRSRWLEQEAAVSGGQARYASLLEKVSDFETALSVLNEKGFEFERLKRELVSAEAEYLLYRQKHEEARISTAMNQQQMVDVSIVRQPMRPFNPVAPRKKLNMVLALVVGSIGSLGVAFGREFGDHTITSVEHLESRLGLRSLASIPEVDTL